MPRTLHAGVTQAITAQQYGYDVLIEAPTIGLRLSWFFEPDATWEHRLLHVDAVEVGITPGGGLGFVSQLTFAVAEDDTGQSILVLDESSNLYGAQISLKLLFTDQSYPNAIPLFTGHIVHWETWEGETTVTATDERLTRNVLLPQTVVTLATHPNAPEGSIGQALPIIYGYGNTLAPIPLLLIDQTTSIYQVSEHQNAEMIPVFGAWPPGTDRLKTVTAASEQAAIIGTNQLRLLQRLTETKLGVNTALPTLHSETGTVVNSGNLLDEDPETLTVITTQAGNGIGRIRLDYTHPDPVGINTVDIQLLNHRKADSAAVTVHGNFVLDTIRQDGTTAIRGLFASLERRIQTSPQNETFHVFGIALEPGHYLRMAVSAVNETGAAGAATDAYQVGQIVVEAFYLVPGPFEPIYLPDIALSTGSVFEEDVFEDDVFAETLATSFKGRTDDATGTITGTPNAVLESPVDILASILKDELGLTLDAPTLAAARTARQTWKAAGGVGYGWFRQRTTAMDLLHSLCLQAGCYLYPKGNGDYIIKALAPLESATFTVGPAGSANDFILYERGDPTGAATEWRRTFRYRGGRSDQIRNAFEIRYSYHAARQTFGKIAQASWLGTSDTASRLSAGTIELLQSSHDRYGIRDPYLLDADFIYDDDTAYFLLDLLIPYWFTPRQEVEFESTMAPLPLLLGETVSVDTVGMPAGMRGQVFEVDRLRYDFEQGRIFLHGTQRGLFQIDYFRIRDQSNTIWYWWIDDATEQLVRDLNPPALPHTVERDITPATIPHWLAIPDAGATTRYVLPNAMGQASVQSTVPSVGTGFTGSPHWTGQRGRIYQLTTTNNEQYDVVEVAL